MAIYLMETNYYPREVVVYEKKYIECYFSVNILSTFWLITNYRQHTTCYIKQMHSLHLLLLFMLGKNKKEKLFLPSNLHFADVENVIDMLYEEWLLNPLSYKKIVAFPRIINQRQHVTFMSLNSTLINTPNWHYW